MINRLSAGRRDRRVMLQRLEEQRSSGSGELAKVPVDIAPVWAEKVPLSGSERYQAGQLAAKFDTTWRILHREDVNPKMQLVDIHDGRVYEIKAVLEIGRRDGLELLTEARAE